MAILRRTASKMVWAGTKAAAVGAGLTATLGLAMGLATLAGVAYAGKADAAPIPTRATIEATQFTIPSVQAGEAFAVCSDTKRALGGGVVQSGPASLFFFQTASGPLDASGTTLNTDDGDIARQWYVAQGNDDRPERLFKAMAICE